MRITNATLCDLLLSIDSCVGKGTMQIGNKKEADENLDNNNDVHKIPAAFVWHVSAANFYSLVVRFRTAILANQSE